MVQSCRDTEEFSNENVNKARLARGTELPPMTAAAAHSLDVLSTMKLGGVVSAAALLFPFISSIRYMSLLRNHFVLAMIFSRLIHARTRANHRHLSFIGITACQRPPQCRLFSSLHSLELSIPTAEDMEDLGAILSMGTGPGDVILLGGDLGAGKTCFSRGFVRAKTGDFDQKVTSPTYLLSNTYDAGNVLYECMLYFCD